MLGHDPGASSQYHPGQQGADDGIADACPCGGDAVFPAKLSCIAHEHHGGKIGGSIGEGGEPGPHGASSQHEAVHIRGVFAAVKTDADEYGEVENQNDQF